MRHLIESLWRASYAARDAARQAQDNLERRHLTSLSEQLAGQARSYEANHPEAKQTPRVRPLIDHSGMKYAS